MSVDDEGELGVVDEADNGLGDKLELYGDGDSDFLDIFICCSRFL
ncbi:hypothetical protein FACS1894122_02190 [Alphaproteobacteria bacterium]|nr:hypothetical protein FACS1894122_02190 [Alphaproteobacteria bacterium]